MFAMSVKSVPGCLVLIEPRLIGEPVAATPGFGPQDEVSVDAPLVLEAVRSSTRRCRAARWRRRCSSPVATATSRQREQRGGSQRCESDSHPWHGVITPHGSPLLRVFAGPEIRSRLRAY